MNKLRRKEIYASINKLMSIKNRIESNFDEDVISGYLEDVYNDVDCILSDETSYMENIPENLQGGSRYEAAEEACDNLQEAVDCIEAASESLDSVESLIKYIDEAIEYLEDASF